MVLDHLTNVSRYDGLDARLQQALEWLKNADFSKLPAGERIIIDGDRIYATVAVTRPRVVGSDDIKLEAHRAYADIQYVISGEECLGYARLGTKAPLTEYNPEKDVQFFQDGWDTLHLKTGDFIIAWPEDLHAPCITTGEASDVKRVVVKVKL